jgi:hypothetical protein
MMGAEYPGTIILSSAEICYPVCLIEGYDLILMLNDVDGSLVVVVVVLLLDEC